MSGLTTDPMKKNMVVIEELFAVYGQVLEAKVSPALLQMKEYEREREMLDIDKIACERYITGTLFNQISDVCE